MNTVYSLREDPSLASMQQASLGATNTGLRQTHGLVGSSEWWARIEDGSLPLQRTSGTIIHFWPGHHGDWPEFEMREEDGKSSNWGCSIPVQAATEHFRLGNRVEVSFVQQERKVAWNGSASTCVVVEIRVGPNPSVKRTAPGVPGSAAYLKR